MEGVWAEEILRERGGSLGNKAVYQLTLLATGSETAARDARADRVAEELAKGETPEY
jgi:hypothetical protein